MTEVMGVPPRWGFGPHSTIVTGGLHAQRSAGGDCSVSSDVLSPGFIPARRWRMEAHVRHGNTPGRPAGTHHFNSRWTPVLRAPNKGSRSGTFNDPEFRAGLRRPLHQLHFWLRCSTRDYASDTHMCYGCEQDVRSRTSASNCRTNSTQNSQKSKTGAGTHGKRCSCTGGKLSQAENRSERHGAYALPPTPKGVGFRAMVSMTVSRAAVPFSPAVPSLWRAVRSCPRSRSPSRPRRQHPWSSPNRPATPP